MTVSWFQMCRNVSGNGIVHTHTHTPGKLVCTSVDFLEQKELVWLQSSSEGHWSRLSTDDACRLPQLENHCSFQEIIRRSNPNLGYQSPHLIHTYM